MKSLAFLFIASILFLFVGLLVTEGQTPPPVPAQASEATTAPRPPTAKGSANQKPKPPQTPAVRAEKSDFAEAIATDNLCLAAPAIGRLGDATYPAEIRGLLRAFGAPSSLQEMFAENGPIYGAADAKKRYPSNFLNLMYALRLSNLLNFSGAGSASPDNETPLAILQELEAADEDELYVNDLSDRIAGYSWRYAPYVSRDKADCDRTAFDNYYEEMRGHP